MEKEFSMSEEESLRVISSMIAKAKTSYHDTGTGPILWGVVISLCALTTWVQLHFNFKLPFDIWFLTFVAVIPTIILSMRESKLRRAKMYDETAMNYLWTCFGISIFLIIHANNAIGSAFSGLKDTIEQAGMQRPAVSFSDFSSASLLVMYGIPTIITSGIKNFKPMLYGGVFCWISAVLVVYTPREVDMLLMAASAIFAWLIPGIILRRKCRNKNL